MIQEWIDDWAWPQTHRLSKLTGLEAASQLRVVVNSDTEGKRKAVGHMWVEEPESGHAKNKGQDKTRGRIQVHSQEPAGGRPPKVEEDWTSEIRESGTRRSLGTEG